jgi:RHS repeat-associated protein
LHHLPGLTDTMPATTGFSARARLHTVGDPIDVVSGANIDLQRDFILRGALPVDWRRVYDSRQSHRVLRVGRGFSHAYAVDLRIDLDGLALVEPPFKAQHFPFAKQDGDTLVGDGVRIQRVDRQTYVVARSDQTHMIFAIDPQTGIGALQGIRTRSDLVRIAAVEPGIEEWTCDGGRRLRIEQTPSGLVGRVLLAAPTLREWQPLLEYQYDASGALLSARDVYGFAVTFAYDESGRVTRKTDRQGYSFQFRYDNAGRCVWSAGDDGLYEVTLDYRPAQGRTIVDKRGSGRWEYHHDDVGQITRVVAPDGGTTLFGFHDDGRVKEEIDAVGRKTVWQYDQAGGLLGKTGPLGAFTAEAGSESQDHVGYYQLGTCPSEWENGSVFDRISSGAPAGVKGSVRRSGEADTRPRLRRVAGPSSYGAEYDLLGRLTVEHRDGAARAYQHDGAGNVTQITDFDGSTHRYAYTSWDLRTQASDPTGLRATATYSPSTAVTSVTDGNGNVTTFEYDPHDRVREIVHAGDAVTRYEYDLGGQLIAARDAAGELLFTRAIDAGAGKVTIEGADGSVEERQYDKKGRLTAASAGGAQIEFAYDAVGRRTRDMRDGRGVVHEQDPRGRSKTTVLDRFVIRYTLGADGLSIIDPAGKRHTARHIDEGRVQTAYSSGLVVTSSYGATGEVRERRARHRDGLRESVWRYQYAPDGALVTEDDAVYGRRAFTYDGARRVIGAADIGGEPLRYSYDACDNVLTVNGRERATYISGNRLATWGTQTFEYDTRHRIVARSDGARRTLYSYDARDRLVAISDDRLTWTAKYDALGRRTQKIVDGRTTEFFWDTDRLAAELVPNGAIRIYVYLDRLALTPILFVEWGSLEAPLDSGRTYSVVGNQLGTPIWVENDAGECVWNARYAPYGALERSDAKIRVNIRAPGHYADAETGLHYNRFRYYDPRLGRYLQPDPIGLAGGLNLFAYTTQPLNHVDLRGTCPTVERRVWSEEELAEAAEKIKQLRIMRDEDLRNLAQKPVTLTPEQAALHARLDAAAKFPPGFSSTIPPDSRVPVEGPVRAADLHALTQLTGCEHAYVIDPDGNHMITRGDANGPGASEADRTLVHTHPHDTPPSPADLRLAREPGQAVIGPDGRVTDYDRNGQNPHATTSPIRDDGIIDGNQHPITPIVTTVDE